MDQIKIGKFIADTRTAKKLTQEELAKEIGVTDKAISKWENGRCLPDVSLFKPLCNALDISINELLNGEKDTKKTNEDGYINYIKETNKKNKLKLILTILVSKTILVLLILSIYFLNNYGKTTVYKLYGESENFTYREGLLTVSNEKYILSTGIVKTRTDALEEAKILSIRMVYNDSIISNGYFQKGNTILTEYVGYNEMFSKEKINNLDKWTIEIVYYYENKIHEEIIVIKNEELLKTNKFFSTKSIPIGRDELQKQDQKSSNNNEDSITFRDALLADGFSKTDNPMIVEKKIGDSLYEVDWYAKQIRYTYKDKEGNTCEAIFVPTIWSTIYGGYYKEQLYRFSFSEHTKQINCITGDNCPPYAQVLAQNQYKIFKDILNK